MKSALLVLEDGNRFYGYAIGAEGETVGEVVFNTSMTGYQEIITDPSYAYQIVILTCPHIGNVGTNEVDNESSCIQVRGLIIRDLAMVVSNFRYTLSLSEYLVQQNIVGIAGVDTRKLTRLIRAKGVQHGCIIACDMPDPTLALRKAREFPGLNGLNLVREVSTSRQYIWNQGTWNIKSGVFFTPLHLPYRVVVYDFGVKRNIMRILVDYGCLLTVVPAHTTAQEIIDMQPDGVFLANGPGDPNAYEYAINSIQTFLNTTTIPLFGICLGHQLLALASGAKTIKMKFGHHGSNHPVKDIETNKVIITAQNHNFVVDKQTLPDTLKITHISLFDGTLQGIHHINKPAFSFQGHPEASPGPHDAASSLFSHFIKLIKNYRNK
ncbi:glutamine-hydrolyzing carbamoyl-phosphate synthase small subunit [Blochmannia endosymbiont of Camponotus sp.]|uniref:glutamine-hydrolyzing carbamoyl-phosphate synthase small subunit n=1 Tax=Blochmannia endosymbiont of Camponotus sp. TaxID=700220 RepID=UPI002024B01D|nr:glutamine-hydrolyzing carbamoyl-phosphate synthase small subunit [Blochmannia endosymbiont of Camponotus sp.]URJ24043.1 glutamine-hydrolyzing carbamoyl-phosphate synthase small subunit [Blochmannia endosymbiont of Camponotus sp.]URJ25763.1 glutamine-hydrolyzing carbamoyl-phosphate synthase small subunit [Blochmannia endosymbiont of Camponotus sp.]